MTSFEGIDNKYKLKNNLKDLMYGRELKECYQLEAYYITMVGCVFELFWAIYIPGGGRAKLRLVVVDLYNFEYISSIYAPYQR